LLKLAIIDHNKLDLTQQQWDDSVVQIVDHHVDLHAYPDIDRLVVACGSACSLAMDFIFKDGLDDKILTKKICKFFSSAILLDTENFKPSLFKSKWYPIDEEVFLLINKLSIKKYYNTLINKKTDKKLNIALGLDLILKKDYKNYDWGNSKFTFHAGISVIFNPIYEVMIKFGIEGFKNKLKTRISEGSLNIYCILSQTYLDNGKVQREFVFFYEDQVRLNKITEKFEKEFFSLYQEVPQRKKFTGLADNFAFYGIKNESISRKKIEPILKDIFSSFE